LQLPADYTRTCIPLEEATGKYNLKVRATPAKVRFGKGRLTPLESLVIVYLFILLGLNKNH